MPLFDLNYGLQSVCKNDACAGNGLIETYNTLTLQYINIAFTNESSEDATVQSILDRFLGGEQKKRASYAMDSSIRNVNRSYLSPRYFSFHSALISLFLGR